MDRAHRKALRGGPLAEAFFAGAVGLFGLAVLLQVFLAGDAALLAPETWQAHVAWIHIFQWISVALPIAAQLGGGRIGFTLLNCLPMALIALQYWLIHVAIRHGVATFVGLHAVAGALLFGLLIFIVQEWRYRRASKQDC